MAATLSTATVDGFLFDMDGTLLDSTPGVLATWDIFAQKYDLDLEQVLKTAHGVRTIDNLRNFCKITDPVELIAESERFENTIVEQAHRLVLEGKTGLVILPGVFDLLTKLNTAPKPVWAIVTSATRKYATAALPTAGIPPYPALVTADDVTKGKPFPEPYLVGGEKLGYPAGELICVEDAPSGIRSGVAAGNQVLAVCTSHTRAELEGLGARWIVEDLTKVKVEFVENGKIQVSIEA